MPLELYTMPEVATSPYDYLDGANTGIARSMEMWLNFMRIWIYFQISLD
jgi:hypothetical protein